MGDKKLLRAGMVPARTWEVHAQRMSPTERLKIRRQMAAAAGKKSITFHSLFMEAHGLEVEVEEELSTIQVRRPAGAVMRPVIWVYNGHIGTHWFSAMRQELT